jgi:hypothetical protein
MGRRDTLKRPKIKRAKLKKAPPVNIKKLLRLLFMYNTQQ